MKILRMAAGAAGWFSEARCLPVHSVYKNTVNLQCSTGILAIQTAGLQATPFSVETDASEGSLKAVFAGIGRVSLFPDGLLAGETRFSLPENCEIYDGRFVAAASPKNGEAAAEMIRKLLWRFAPQDSFFALAEPQRLPYCGRFSGAAEGAAIVNAALELPKSSAAMEKISELIGLGQGLTPAGDDFLLGILAALDLYGAAMERVALCTALKSEKTNRISAAFLRAAADGVYGEYLLRLLQALAGNATQTELADCVVRVLQTGHTSGSDMLSGILWCMDAIERKKRKCFLTVRSEKTPTMTP